MSDPVRLAGLRGWERVVHAEEVWGTVVVIDIRGPSLDRDAVATAVRQGCEFLHQVDAWFSTYRIDSPVTALRNGLADPAQMPAVVRQVLDRCAEARDLTEGAFDPWAVPGGVDPSGYVKGWAADQVAAIVTGQGLPNVSVNAAGDVTCRGQQAPDEPWVVGIRHPDDALAVVRTVTAADCAVATSGEYERGRHITRPPRSSAPGLTAQPQSATVVGPDGGLADALATALVVAGPEGLAWLERLPGWSAYVITDGRAAFLGPAFASDAAG